MEKQYIVFTSEYGSGARLIAQQVSEELSIPFYGEEDLLNEAVKYLNVDEKILHNFDLYGEVSEISTEQIIDSYKTIILNKVQEGPCILMERGSDYILKNKVPFLNVYVYTSNIDKKIERAVKIGSRSDENAEIFIQQQEASRLLFYQRHTDIDRGKLSEYDLCINSDSLSDSALDMTKYVDIIKQAIKK